MTKHNNEQIFFVIADESHINHTTLALSESEAIEEFIRQEETMHIFVNVGKLKRGEEKMQPPNWEDYKKEGYKVVQVKIVLV